MRLRGHRPRRSRQPLSPVALAVLALALCCWTPRCAADDGADGGSGLAVNDGEGCPAGYFRAAPILFACGGTAGLARALLPPNGTAAIVNVSEGVRYFKVSASSLTSAGVELELYDPAAGAVVAGRSRDDGASKNSSSSSSMDDFHGVRIVFHQGPGAFNDSVQDNLYILGTSPSLLQLRFRNAHWAWSEVTLNYSYDGNEECPWAPSGCSVFNESASFEYVGRWSTWAQKEFQSSGEAWEVLGKKNLDHSARGGVRWYRWPAVFSQGWNSSDPSVWHSSFHLLDLDGDGEISEPEFKLGFDLRGPSAGDRNELAAARSDRAAGIPFGADADARSWQLLIMTVCIIAAIVCFLFCCLCACRRGSAEDEGSDDAVFESKKMARTVISRSSEKGLHEDALEHHSPQKPQKRANIMDAPSSPASYLSTVSGVSGASGDYARNHGWGAFVQRLPAPLLRFWPFDTYGPNDYGQGAFRYGPLPSNDDYMHPGAPVPTAASFMGPGGCAGGFGGGHLSSAGSFAVPGAGPLQSGHSFASAPPQSRSFTMPQGGSFAAPPLPAPNPNVSVNSGGSVGSFVPAPAMLQGGSLSAPPPLLPPPPLLNGSLLGGASAATPSPHQQQMTPAPHSSSFSMSPIVNTSRSSAGGPNSSRVEPVEVHVESLGAAGAGGFGAVSEPAMASAATASAANAGRLAATPGAPSSAPAGGGGRPLSPRASRAEVEAMRAKLQGPGLAVFTPEEWEQTTRLIEQQRGGGSPGVGALPLLSVSPQT